MKKLIYILPTLFIAFSGCDTEDDLVQEIIDTNPPPSPPSGDPGTLDFSNYVAIGNSTSAGFMDAALYNDGQLTSFPNILSKQMLLANGGDFNQPDINSENGFNTAVPNPDPNTGAIIGRFILNVALPGPITITQAIGAQGDPIGAYTGDASQLNNFGVPGITLAQMLIPGTAIPSDPAFNPFYARFASSPGTSTVVGDIIGVSPSFFTLWAGNNDLLLYATSGASVPSLLTDPGDFDTRYNTIVDNLINSSSANGVIISIPPVTVLPFFRAVPYNPIPLDDSLATVLNGAFAGLNGVLDALAAPPFSMITAAEAASRKVTWVAGQNPALIFDETLTDIEPGLDALLAAMVITPTERALLEPYRQSRQTAFVNPTNQDLLLFTAATALGVEIGPGQILGTTIPLADQFALTPAEQLEINTNLVAFNTTIATAALSNPGRVAFLDINDPTGTFYSLFGLDGSELGIVIEGQRLQPDFSPNGVFSTDGIHVNPRGNAIVANEVIKAIEAHWPDTSIPKATVLRFRGVVFGSY